LEIFVVLGEKGGGITSGGRCGGDRSIGLFLSRGLDIERNSQGIYLGDDYLRRSQWPRGIWHELSSLRITVFFGLSIVRYSRD
jgi:hypothetical protein